MEQPQAQDEVDLVVAALRERCHDGLLDIRWNPEAHVVRHARIDAVGHSGRPEYAGRWEVIRRDNGAFALQHRHRAEGFTVICRVTERIDHGGIPAMRIDGEYAPVGMWLVEFMQAADSANKDHFQKIRDRLWRETEQLEAHEAKDQRAADVDASERVYFHGTKENGISEFHPVGIDLAGRS